jgi:hypothetical protein
MVFSMLEIFLNRAVIGTVVTALIGVGVGVMRTSPPKFTAAKWCFSAAYLTVLLRLSWWMVMEQTEGTPSISAINIFLLLGFIGVLWVGLMMWVENKRKAPAPLRDHRKIAEPKS